MTIKCPVCNKYEATKDTILGVLPCSICQDRRGHIKTSAGVEFTSESIKEDRKKYSKDILQPFRSGEVSKEYLEKYGTQGIEVTKEDIKKAVNTTDSYYD